MSAWTCGSCGGENPEGMRFCGHCGAPAEAAAAPETAATEADVTSALRSFVAGAVADRLVEGGGELPEERLLITALFADVSGFTSLADRLDPEELLEVIDPVISGLSSIVGRYEGYVEKFAGDALLALFGAPVTHEDDATRALLVALEMHDELARMCDELPHQAELTLHVGVNSGHGIARILGSEARMDYAVLGDSVILAQRLESSAPAGETYVSELTYRMTEDQFEFEPVGVLTLKGKAEPVPAWRLIGRRGVSPTAARPRTALVGRSSEVATVARVLDAVRDAQGGAISVLGEPGIGKTRLTEEARRLAGTKGVRWLHARCLSYGVGLAYWPFTDLLRDVAGISGGDDAPADPRGALTRTMAEVPEVLPYFQRLLGLPVGEGSEVDHLEPEAFRRRLHDAFAVWLRTLATETPIVLALEDVHWMDASSLALTRELARLSSEYPLVLYVVGRPEAAPSLDEIAPHGETISLGPLDSHGIAELLEHLLDGRPPRTLVELVRERTEGNPLFASELVRELRETRVLVQKDGRWRTRPGWESDVLPPTIEGVLAARIDRLPRDAATTLQNASVIGRRVRLALLEAVGAGLRDLRGSIDRLVEHGFLDRVDDGEDTFAFHHALVQDVAYGRLLRRKRRDLHRRVAEVAEALYGAGDDTVDLLARHLYLGEAGPRAFDYLLRAGDRSKRLYANQEAILHFTRAVEVAGKDVAIAERVPEVQLTLAGLHELVGDYGEALRLYAQVRDATGDVRAWHGMASAHRSRGEYPDALDLIERAFQADELRDADLTLLWIEQGRTLSLAGRLDQAIDVLEAGLTTAGQRRDPLVGQLLLHLARPETLQRRLDSALTHALQAKAIFEAHDDLRNQATAARLLGDIYRSRNQLDEAAETLRQGLELAQRIGNAEEIAGCLMNLGIVERRRGALPEAIACIREALDEFERIGHGSGRAGGYANLAVVLAQAGDLDEAERACERDLEISREIGYSMIAAEVTDTMADIAFRRRALPEAAARAEEAATLFLELGAAPRAAQALEVASQAWEAAGEDERAREMAERARAALVGSHS